MYERLLYITAERMKPSEPLHLSERLASRSALVVYTVSGSLTLRCDYNRWTTEAGYALLVNERSEFELDSTGGSEFYLVRFAAAFENDPPFVLRRAEDPGRVLNLLEELCRCAASTDYPEEACDYLVRLLMIELSRRSLREAPDDSKLFPEVLAYLEENSSADLTAAKVAAHFGYSTDYLTRGFKAYYGRGLKSAIDAVRLAYIRQRLLEPYEDTAALAESCGFRSYKSLSDFFKYNTGMSIGAYRSGKK